MPNKQIVYCRECVFFIRFEEGHRFLGYCRFNAPVILPKVDNENGHFPIVKDSFFCGQGEIPEGQQKMSGDQRERFREPFLC